MMSKPCLMRQYGVPVVLKTWCLIQEAVILVFKMIRYLMTKSLTLKVVMEVPNMVLLLISISLFMICSVINPMMDSDITEVDEDIHW